jgi:dienelactone hydrolase
MVRHPASSAEIVIDPVRIESNRITFSWTPSKPGATYVVESQDSLDSSAWVVVPDIAWPITATEFVDPRPMGNGVRYYRVVAAEGTSTRGRLIKLTPIRRIPKSEIETLIALFGASFPVKYDVQYFNAEYETIGVSGEPTTASGAVAIPVNASGALPLVSYQHGTVLEKEDVPSRLNLEGYIVAAMAGSGYVAVAPDYLGLGDSAYTFHPYHHAASEASSVVDLLRAGRQVAASNQVELSPKLFLFGYSQGGHATLAAHRELEQNATGEFQLTASAPGAGAYDLSGTTLEDGLSERRPPNPYYLAYILFAYQKIYAFSPTLESVLQSPYDAKVPPLFDRFHGSVDVNAAMPALPSAALKPEWLDALRQDPDHPLRVALRDNDLLDWAPQAPVRLYHCHDDEDVVFANSQVALARLKAAGGRNVTLVDGGAFDHGGCVAIALLGAKGWFDSLK